MKYFSRALVLDRDLIRLVGVIGLCLVCLAFRPAHGWQENETAAESPGTNKGDGENLLQTGETLLEKNAAAEAERVFKKAIAHFERTEDKEKIARARFLLGYSLAMQDRMAEALKEHKTALQLKCLLYGDTDRDDIAASVDAIGMCLLHLSRPQEAKPLLEDSLEMYRRLHTGDHESVATGLLNLGFCLVNLSRNAEAIKYYSEAVSMLKKLHTGDHPLTAAALNNLGRCYQYLGYPVRAMPVLEEALEMRRRLYKGDHLHVAEGIGNIGSCLRRMGRNQEALARNREALAMFRRLYKGDSVRIASMLTNIGLCLDALGFHEEAYSHHKESVAIYHRLYRGDHFNTSIGLNNMALSLVNLGRHAEALVEHEAALGMRRRLIRGDHEYIVTSLMNTASCLIVLGRPEQAYPKLEAAREMQLRLQSGDHFRHAMLLQHEGHCLGAMARPGEALSKLRAGLDMYHRLYRWDHPEKARTLGIMAYCLNLLGRPAEALSAYKATLAMFERLYPGDHSSVAVNMNNVAVTLNNLGRPVEALGYYEKALAMRKRLHQDDHPSVASSLSNLAYCLDSLDRTEEALPLFQEAFDMYRRLHTGDHANVAKALDNIGGCLDSLGRLTEALSYVEDSLAMRRRLFQEDNIDVASSLNNVAGIRKTLGDSENALSDYEEALGMSRRLGSRHTHRFAANAGLLLLVYLDRPEQSIPYFEEAIELLEGFRAGARDIEERDLAVYYSQLKESGAFQGMVLAQLRMDRREEALAFVEQSRGRSIRDLLARSRLEPLAEVARRARKRHDVKREKEALKLVEDVAKSHREVVHLSQELSRAREREDLEADPHMNLVDSISDDLKKAQEAERNLLKQKSLFVEKNLPMAMPATVAAMRHLLEPGQRLLYYFLSDLESHAFLISRGTEVQGFPLIWEDKTPVRSDEVAELVAGLYADVAGKGKSEKSVWSEKDESKPGHKPPGHALFQALLPEKLREELKDLSLVYVIPHGPLHNLPFEALVAAGTSDEEEEAFWLEQGPDLVYGTSASALLWTRMQREEQRDASTLYDVLALGDPEYTSQIRRKDLGAVPADGVLVLAIQEGSQAAMKGILAEDVILSYNGKELVDGDSLSSAIQETSGNTIEEGSEDKEITIGLWRSGKRLEISVRPGRLGVQTARESARKAVAELRSQNYKKELLTLQHNQMEDRHGLPQELPGSRYEVASIYTTHTGRPFDKNDLHPEQDGIALLLGEDATEKKLFQLASDARIIHLATHGFADETAGGSFSGLLLTAPSELTKENDGYLSLQDLLDSWCDRLANCALVVLSACKTQKGKMQMDEGVFALPVGFMYAGAPSVIASLWKVDDTATALLMHRFYENLLGRYELPRGSGEPGEKMTKAEALREAKIWLRNLTAEEAQELVGKLPISTSRGELELVEESDETEMPHHPYAAPYFWAAFILIGDPE